MSENDTSDRMWVESTISLVVIGILVLPFGVALSIEEAARIQSEGGGNLLVLLPYLILAGVEAGIIGAAIYCGQRSLEPE
jgi:hypothetical protein